MYLYVADIQVTSEWTRDKIIIRTLCFADIDPYSK